jgi:hypothetical protein
MNNPETRNRYNLLFAQQESNLISLGLLDWHPRIEFFWRERFA